MWVIQLFWASPLLDECYRWQEGRSRHGGRSWSHLWRTQCPACQGGWVWNFRFSTRLRSDRRIFASSSCLDQFSPCTGCSLSHLLNTFWIVSFIRSWELVSLIFFKFPLPRLDEWMPLLSFFSLLLDWLLCQLWRIVLFSSNTFSLPFLILMYCDMPCWLKRSQIVFSVRRQFLSPVYCKAAKNHLCLPKGNGDMGWKREWTHEMRDYLSERQSWS